MNLFPIHNVFDDADTRAMGAAFDQACVSLWRFVHDDDVRELIAKRIIDAARSGVRHPAWLHAQAIQGFAHDTASLPVRQHGPRRPRRIYASVARKSVIAESPAGRSPLRRAQFLTGLDRHFPPVRPVTE